MDEEEELLQEIKRQKSIKKAIRFIDREITLNNLRCLYRKRFTEEAWDIFLDSLITLERGKQSFKPFITNLEKFTTDKWGEFAFAELNMIGIRGSKDIWDMIEALTEAGLMPYSEEECEEGEEDYTNVKLFGY